MKTILEFRQEIEGLLENELGLYTYPSGTTKTASCVLPDPVFGWDYPPPETVVTGLELVIIPDKEIKFKPLLTTGGIKTKYIEIILKQWTETKSTVNATNILIDKLDEFLMVQPRVIPQYNLKNIEVQKILVDNKFLIY